MNMFPNSSPAQVPRQPAYPTLVSKIPPRGYRPLRKPKEYKGGALNYPKNVPILNELAANEPRVGDNQRGAHDDRVMAEKLAQAEISRQHQRRIDFFSSVTNPPESLPMPDTPTIEAISGVSIHRDAVPGAVSGVVFSVKEMQEIPAIAQEDEAVMMHNVQHM